jgi:hypothetical protein
MQAETRIAELQRAIAAGEYAPSSDVIAAEIVTKLVLIRQARRRIEAATGATFEREKAPPQRRFDPATSLGTLIP